MLGPVPGQRVLCICDQKSPTAVEYALERGAHAAGLGQGPGESLRLQQVQDILLAPLADEHGGVVVEHGYLLDGELLDERGGLLREQLPVLDDELVLSAAAGIRVPEACTVVDR